MKVKYYRVEGRMLISHDRYPRWQKFRREVRGLRVEDVLERVYSELGSRHKLRRAHIKIEKVEEIPSDQVTDPLLLQFEKLERILVVK